MLPGFFGSGAGPLRRAAPAVRLLTGGLVLAAVLLLPAWPAENGWVMLALATAMALACGLPLRHGLKALSIGLLLYTPLVLLLAAPTLAPLVSEAFRALFEGEEAARRWLLAAAADPATGHMAGIVARGVCSLIVSIATLATLTPGDVHPALGGLPLPRTARLILLQVVQQTGMLLDETRRVRHAVAVRGAGTGALTDLVLVRSLPAAWLARVAGRAERVAMALDVRGYVEAPLPAIPLPHRWSAADGVALGLGTVALLGALLLRFGT
jgi:energy-coupling factor transporter transmembrane protein EcfT